MRFREKSTDAIRARLDAGRTVVLITHDMIALRLLCTRAVWVDGGVTRLSGTVDAVERAVRGEPAEPVSEDFFPTLVEGEVV